MCPETISRALEGRHGRTVVSAPEAGRMLGIGREVAYHEARSGNLGGVLVIRLGKKLVVPLAALKRVLTGETLPGQEAPASERGQKPKPRPGLRAAARLAH